jgi:multicomponent Na+:H+ antiporter subunit A
MFLIVMAGFAGAFIVPAAYKLFGKHAGKILALLPAGIFAYLLGYIGPVSDGEIISQTVSWFPSLGIDLTFRADGLGLLFALIISGIGAAVFLFASEYMESYRYKDRFYIYINLFMASMLGVVLTDNMIAMFVFWELTSITSFLLIGFNHHKEESRYSAWQALLVTGLGGLSLLAGLIILSIITGTVNLSELAAQSDIIQSSELFIPAMILVLGGAFTKSAQFPFYFWLPNAMAAPTPVSAYLHSATMVKAGIYLMARLNPALGGNDYWNYTLAIAGGATMIIGAWTAIINTDLKRILAYTTVSVLGTLTMLIGFNSETAIKAMVIYLLAHSLYKGTLFLVAGTIDHETGTRHIDKLSGLRKYLPVTFFSGALAALSMAGLAPFIGFIGKETVYEAAKKFAMGEFWLGLVVVAGILTVIGGGMAGLKPFLGKSKYPGKSRMRPAGRCFSGRL